MDLPSRSLLAATCLALSAAATAADVSGRWASTDHVTYTGSKTGSRFFLDVTIGKDGAFKGTWEEYVCFNYQGPYGSVIVSCQRSKKPSAASGRLDQGTGRIELERLGKSSLKFRTTTDKKGQPQLDLELPRDWQKPGDAVLYEAVLNPKK